MGKKVAAKETTKAENKPKDEVVDEPAKDEQAAEEEEPAKDEKVVEEEKAVGDEPAKDEKAEEEPAKDAEEVEAKESEETAEEATTEEEDKPAENGDVNGHAGNKEGKNADDDTKVNGTANGEKRTKRGRPKKTEEEKEKKNEEENGESSEEEELPPGLYDGPVSILTGKRSKKSVEKYIATPDSKWSKLKNGDDEEFDYSKGPGLSLKEIPFVKYQITQSDNEDLVVLHRLMYGRKGKINEIMKNVLAFKGYPFDEKAAPYKSAIALAHRLTIPGLKFINDLLGLEVCKEKDKGQVMEDALMDFLREPKDLGLEIPANVVVEPKKSTRKPGKRKSKSKGIKKGYVEVTDEEDDDEEEDEEEEEDDGKSRKKGKFNLKVKAPGSKKRGAKRKAATSEASDSSEDEPLVKKKPAKAPTNTIIKKDIAALLKKADLETVTMKNIVRQVYEKYPEFDLTSRKEFIKKTVKEML